MRVFLLICAFLVACLSCGGVFAQESGADGAHKKIPSPAEIARSRHEGRALRAQAQAGTLGPAAETIDPRYLDEMDQIYNTCATSSLYSIYYDCRCQAIKFLDERIKQGPNPPTEYIMIDVNTQCANVPGLAGYAYEDCTKKLSLLNYKDKDFAPFCECFANRFARSYAKNPRLSSLHVQALQKDAYKTCKFGDLRN